MASKHNGVLGVSFEDCSLREALECANRYLNDGILNTVTYISMKSLLDVDDNPERREWLDSVDLLICAEADILRAINITSRSRIREVENNEFLREFLHRYVRNRKKIFLISDNQNNMDSLKRCLNSYRHNLLWSGEYLLDEDSQSAGMTIAEDRLANEINDIAPDLIISAMPAEVQEYLMYRVRNKINADCWLALPINITSNKPIGLWDKLAQGFYRIMLQNGINNRYKEIEQVQS